MFEEKFFLHQIQRKNGNFTKGIVVHNSLNAALQGFYAYMGAYGFEHDPEIDFVECMVTDMSGRVRISCVDDRIPRIAPESNAEG